MTAQVSHDAMANAIRFLSVDAVEKAKSGHPGLPMGAADVATVLFRDVLKFDAADPQWPDRDRFVLSAGHGSMLLYSLLYLTGVGGRDGLTIADLEAFRQVGSKTPGHPEYGHTLGVETTTGPLGQGLATAVGMALAERMLAAEFGEVVDHHTYVLASDGDLMEGVSQEAIAIAGHLKLAKLIVLYDDNGISIDGKTSLSDSVDQLMRFRSAGWRSLRIDGHDPQAILKAIKAAKRADKPTLIACRTTIGFGLPTKAGTSKAHGEAPGAAEIAGARAALKWPYDPFVVPDDILAAWRDVGARGKGKRARWRRALAALPPERRAEFERRIRGDLPAAFDAAVDAYKRQLAADAPEMATRKSGEAALKVIAPVVPELVTGSADLTGSNNTKVPATVEISAGDMSGRYVHWGIREHGMAAACNGMALHGGFIPSGASFMAFTDYARPSLRLAALMGAHVVHVFSHEFDRPGRRRADPSAGRAFRRAARHPEPAAVASGRRGRDRRMLAGGAGGVALALDPCVDAPEPAGAAQGPCRGEPVRARRLRNLCGAGEGGGVDLRFRVRKCRSPSPPRSCWPRRTSPRASSRCRASTGSSSRARATASR